MCPENTFAYPGDNKCIEKRECDPIYDLTPIFSPCHNGSRRLSYQWPASGYCKGDKNKLPEAKFVECEKCVPGQYRSQETQQCVKCEKGYFSETFNAESCEPCLAGHYIPKITKIDNIEFSLPDGFSTYCENVQGGVYVEKCLKHKGWIIANKSLVAHPQISHEVQIVLRRFVNISESKGNLEFAYSYGEGIIPDNNYESLIFTHDGVYESIF